MEVKIKIGDEMIDAKIVMMNGNMIVSPKVEKFKPKEVKYMYKVGEVIFVRSIYKHIVIYKESANGYLYSYVDLVEGLLDIDDTPVCNECDITEIRPATEEEKKKLFDKLAEEGWEWDADKKELVKLKWKPKIGEAYYRPNFLHCRFVCYSGTADYNKIIYVKDYINKGWIFRTKEECEAFCDKLNQAIESVEP